VSLLIECGKIQNSPASIHPPAINISADPDTGSTFFCNKDAGQDVGGEIFFVGKERQAPSAFAAKRTRHTRNQIPHLDNT
jgi:hypothetical protein